MTHEQDPRTHEPQVSLLLAQLYLNDSMNK